MASLVETFSITFLLLNGFTSLDGKNLNNQEPLQEQDVGNVSARALSYLVVNMERHPGTKLRGQFQTNLQESQKIKLQQQLWKYLSKTQKIGSIDQFQTEQTKKHKALSVRQLSQKVRFADQQPTSEEIEKERNHSEESQTHARESHKTELLNHILIETREDRRPNFDTDVPLLWKRSRSSEGAKSEKDPPKSKESRPKATKSPLKLGEPHPSSKPSRSNAVESRPKSRESTPKAKESHSNSNRTSKLKENVHPVTDTVPKMTPIIKIPQLLSCSLLKKKNSVKAGIQKYVSFKDGASKRSTSGLTRNTSDLGQIQVHEYPAEESPHPYFEDWLPPEQVRNEKQQGGEAPQWSPPKSPEINEMWDYISRHGNIWTEKGNNVKNLEQTHEASLPFEGFERVTSYQSQDLTHADFSAASGRPVSTKSQATATPVSNTQPQAPKSNSGSPSQRDSPNKENKDVKDFIDRLKTEWSKSNGSPVKDQNSQMPPGRTNPPTKSPSPNRSSSSSPSPSPSPPRLSPQSAPKTSSLTQLCSDKCESLKNMTPPKSTPPRRKLKSKDINEQYEAMSNRIKSGAKKD